jgi:polar amino acid transport system substrate-binding protein
VRRALVVGLWLVLAAPAGAEVPTRTPGELVAALAMPAAGFQTGAVSGRDVVFAKGFEVDLVEALAEELSLPDVRFVNEERFSALLAPGDWDMAVAQITITRARERRLDFSDPYYRADQGVLLRSGLVGAPESLETVARLRLCAERGTTGADVVKRRIKPTRTPRIVPDLSALEAALYEHRCDAAVADAPQLAVMRAAAPRRFGALAGRIETGERYGIAFQRGSDLRPLVDVALERLREDGTLRALKKRWLKAASAKLRVLE